MKWYTIYIFIHGWCLRRGTPLDEPHAQINYRWINLPPQSITQPDRSFFSSCSDGGGMMIWANFRIMFARWWGCRSFNSSGRMDISLLRTCESETLMSSVNLLGVPFFRPPVFFPFIYSRLIIEIKKGKPTAGLPLGVCKLNCTCVSTSQSVFHHPWKYGKINSFEYMKQVQAS